MAGIEPNDVKTRIVLIGPILPFRGGIAQHTTMLHRAMRPGCDLLTISFSHQYPRWLFPGKSDRDPAYSNYREPGVDYLIDSKNPLSWKKAVQGILDFRPDSVIIPWWTVYWAFCFRYIAKQVRGSGATVVLLCHNVIEHESSRWKHMLTRSVFAQADRFVVHTHQDAANLANAVVNPRVEIHPHPIYSQFPEPEQPWQRRARLELLFYGFVRPYKGLGTLLEAMALLADLDVKLTVAGEFWDGEDAAKHKIQALGLSDRVELRPRYHTERETAQLFDRADCVILPYRSATGTGVIPIAYHYNKPVVVTRVGGLPDIVLDGTTGFVVDPESPQSLAQGIKRCEAFRPLPGAFDEMKRRMSWESMAEALIGP